jgi:hypothetical protein
MDVDRSGLPKALQLRPLGLASGKTVSKKTNINNATQGFDCSNVR